MFRTKIGIDNSCVAVDNNDSSVLQACTHPYTQAHSRNTHKCAQLAHTQYVQCSLGEYRNLGLNLLKQVHSQKYLDMLAHVVYTIMHPHTHTHTHHVMVLLLCEVFTSGESNDIYPAVETFLWCLSLCCGHISTHTSVD